MNYQAGKLAAVFDQLDWAITLFLEHHAYVPAITLAGAAEEIIGEAVSSGSTSPEEFSRQFSAADPNGRLSPSASVCAPGPDARPTRS